MFLKICHTVLWYETRSQIIGNVEYSKANPSAEVKPAVFRAPMRYSDTELSWSRVLNVNNFSDHMVLQKRHSKQTTTQNSCYVSGVTIAQHWILVYTTFR